MFIFKVCFILYFIRLSAGKRLREKTLRCLRASSASLGKQRQLAKTYSFSCDQEKAGR